jgi:hypothetical protein
VLCAIQEWSTGRRTDVSFTHAAYVKEYQRFLKGLRTWKAHAAKKLADKAALTDIADDLLEAMLRNAR